MEAHRDDAPERSETRTMTDKELRKLRRVELLELLVDQAAEMEELRRQLDQANEALAQRRIQLEEAGSIAEAALRLNGVFEAADKAAKEYLDSAREMAQKREALLRRTQEDAEQMARELLSRTREECRKLEAETRKQCQAMLERAAQPPVSGEDAP